MTDRQASSRQSSSSLNGTQTITTYEKILAITDQMLIAAQNSNWDELVSLEHDCKQLTNLLIAQHSQLNLTEVEQKKKIAIIQRILTRDAEIRSLTEPWITHLQSMLTSYDRKRKVQQTYRND